MLPAPPWFYDQPKTEYVARATDSCSPGAKAGHVIIYGNDTHMWCQSEWTCGADARWFCPAWKKP